MREKEFFTRPINIDITAATIGINKEDWFCYTSNMTEKNVIETMLFKNYDVVPIVNNDGFSTTYFTIDKAEIPKLQKNIIETDDRLYFLTHIRDVLWIMKKTKKTHFFLSNSHDENDIVGLLSLSNFNFKEFYVYLFGFISYIEREFAALIESDSSQGFAILDSVCQTNGSKSQLKGIKNKYEKDKKNNNENDYKEYLYLHHLIQMVKEEQKYKRLNYGNSQEFEFGTEILKDLRNNIAHPVKSLVTDYTDLEKLESGIDKLYEFKERLDIYLLKTT